MNNVASNRLRTFRSSHLPGLLLLLVATALGVATVYALVLWSDNPRPLLATEETAGAPRPRTGLVATSQNRGQVLFGRYCDSCHTAGREGIGPSFRTSTFKSEYSTADKITGFVRAGGFDMPAFPRDFLSDGDLQLIVQYIESLPVEAP